MDFLKKLDNINDRYVDNANFFALPDIINIQDNELYSLLLKEYPHWLDYPEVKKMIANQGKNGFISKLFKK